MPPDRRDHSEPLFEVKPPADPALESLVLGAIIRDGAPQYEIVSAIISVGDFHLEKNRRVYSRICDLAGRGDPIDRVTVVNELVKNEQLESIGGLVSLVSLDEGLPEVTAIANYCHRLRDLSQRRYLMGQAQALMTRATDEREQVTDIIASLTESIGLVQTGQKDGDLGRRPEQIITEYRGGVGAFMDASLRVKGLTMGFRRLDEVTSGMHAGQLIVIGARPGAGKSSFLLNVAEHLTLGRKKSVVIFSMEMASAAILTRLMLSVARVDGGRFRSGYLTREERRKLQDAVAIINDAELTIFDQFGITVPEIARHARKLKKEGRCDLLGIDYLQLLGSRSKSERRDLEVSAQTRELKILSGELDAPVIALSQLSRSNEKRPGDKVPILSDLRESGAIESDADVVMFIHRPELYSKDKAELKGQAHIIIAKNREGELANILLRFSGNFVRFEDWETNHIAESPAEEPEPQREIIYDDASF